MGVTLIAQEEVVKENYERSIPDLEIPTPLSEKGRKAAQTIRAFMKKHGLGTGGCKTFYSPKEFDKLQEELDTELKKAGVYSEACYGWHGAIYENEGRGHRKRVCL